MPSSSQFVSNSSEPKSSGEFSDSFSRGALCVALSGSLRGLVHEELVLLLSRNAEIEREYARPENGFVGYGTGVHTAMAIGQRWKWQLGTDLPTPNGPDSPHIGARGVDCALLLHDIAKYIPGEAKNSAAEHVRTMKFIEPYLHLLPFAPKQIAVIVDLIDNDTIGEFFMNAFPVRPPRTEKQDLQRTVSLGKFDRSTYHAMVDRWTDSAHRNVVGAERLDELIKHCADNFIARAEKLDLAPLELFDTQVVFYQADTSSYTLDATALGVQATPQIDYIFARDCSRTAGQFFKMSPHAKRLEFAPKYEELFMRVREKIAAA